MAENIQKQVVIELNVNAAHRVVAMGDDNKSLMEECMVLPVVESISNIAYPAFEQATLHLRVDLINMHCNSSKKRKRKKSENTHISRFLYMCASIEFLSF